MSYLYLDIETVGCQDESRVDFEAAIPKNISKAETKLKWLEENRQAVIDKTALDGWLGHVVQISAQFGHMKFSATAKTVQEEHNAVLEFVEYARWANSLGCSIPPTIVGHNIIGFDIPFLWKRAVCLGAKLPSWFPKKPREWSGETVDTMLAFSGYKEFISMDKLCGHLGIEGKGDMDGSMIAQMWKDGKHQEIADYCMDDVQKVKQIHEKMMKAGM
jgi:predicted PolB exonuclease-like 3'-5' exonuclease